MLDRRPLPPRAPLARRSLLAALALLLASPLPALATAPPDGTYLAVLDRFEAGADGRLAVLMLEQGGEVVGDLVVAPDELPSEARHADAVLDVVVEDGELAAATYLPETTDRRAGDSQDRFDRIAHGRCHEEGTPTATDSEASTEAG